MAAKGGARGLKSMAMKGGAQEDIESMKRRESII